MTQLDWLAIARQQEVLTTKLRLVFGSQNDAVKQADALTEALFEKAGDPLPGCLPVWRWPILTGKQREIAEAIYTHEGIGSELAQKADQLYWLLQDYAERDANEETP